MIKPEIIELFDITVDDTDKMIDVLIKAKFELEDVYKNGSSENSLGVFMVIKEIERELINVGCTE